MNNECNQIASILMEIQAISLLPTFQTQRVTDSNAKFLNIKDLLSLGLSIFQACHFMDYFSGKDNEVHWFE
jgi:hypothetical protein